MGETTVDRRDERISMFSSIPFFIMHVLPFLAFFTGLRWWDALIFFVLYYVRMTALTAGYHRYFSHRTYKVNRLVQFLIAFTGGAAAQKGALWWAGHHRHHHKYSDMDEDIHSPTKRGFWWSHCGWILCKKYDATRFDLIPDFAKYPELRFINKFHLLPPILVGTGTFFLGYALGGTASAWAALLFGFFGSTVLLYHVTFMINSLAHVFGNRRYATRDTSRNNLILSLLAGGEGWHNNHHHYMASANQAFRWWEIDTSFYLIKLASFVGLTWDVRKVPKYMMEKHLIKNGEADIGMFEKHWQNALEALENARSKTGAMYGERRKELDALIAATKAKVEEIALLASGPETAGSDGAQ
jgi:stearoyl-CoA desaturase (Delta-9 desaturase)